MNAMSIFSDNLRKYREKTGKQAKEFAKEIDVLYSTYANYEQGRSEPKIDTLIRIADRLNISIDKLLGYTPNEYEQAKQWLLSFKDIYIDDENDIVIISYPFTMNIVHSKTQLQISVLKSKFIDLINAIRDQIKEDIFSHKQIAIYGALTIFHYVSQYPPNYIDNESGIILKYKNENGIYFDVNSDVKAVTSEQTKQSISYRSNEFFLEEHLHKHKDIKKASPSEVGEEKEK